MYEYGVDWEATGILITILIGGLTLKETVKGNKASTKNLELTERSSRIDDYHNRVRFLIDPHPRNKYSGSNGAYLHVYFLIRNIGEVPLEIRKVSMKFETTKGQETIDFEALPTIKPEDGWDYGHDIGGGERIERILEYATSAGKSDFTCIIHVYDILTDSVKSVERKLGTVTPINGIEYRFENANDNQAYKIEL